MNAWVRPVSSIATGAMGAGASADDVAAGANWGTRSSNAIYSSLPLVGFRVRVSLGVAGLPFMGETVSVSNGGCGSWDWLPVQFGGLIHQERENHHRGENSEPSRALITRHTPDTYPRR